MPLKNWMKRKPRTTNRPYKGEYSDEVTDLGGQISGQIGGHIGSQIVNRQTLPGFFHNRRIINHKSL